MRILLTSIIFLSLLLVSCNSSQDDQLNYSEAEENSAPKTLEDYLLQTSKFFNDNSIDQGISKEAVQSQFNISGNTSTWVDSIELASGMLHRYFHFDENRLTAVKLSSYIDSTQKDDLTTTVDHIINIMIETLGKPENSTLYSTSWIANNTSYKLKVFPSEGIDFIISTAINKTQCVGDFFDAKMKFETIVSQKIQDLISLDSLKNINVPGIEIAVSTNELQINYTCEVSKKLVLVDNDLIINALNNICGSKSNVKDDIRFWETNLYELQLSTLENGHLLNFIPKTD